MGVRALCCCTLLCVTSSSLIVLLLSASTPVHAFTRDLNFTFNTATDIVWPSPDPTFAIFLASEGGSLYGLAMYSDSSVPEEMAFQLVISYIPTAEPVIVWRARNPPVRGNVTASLRPDGNFVLAAEASGRELWATNTSGMGVVGMQMQGNGNFVLLNKSNSIVWQSFDHPSESLLQGQKLKPEFDGQMVPYWGLDPFSSTSTSLIAYAEETHGGLALYNEGGTILGSTASAMSGLNISASFANVSFDGNLVTWVVFSNEGLNWQKQFQALNSLCDYPNGCGPYGLCRGNPSQCTCPSPLQQLNASDQTQGCLQPSRLCEANVTDQQFLNLTGVDYISNKFSVDFDQQVNNPVNLTLEECASLCWNNCSCAGAFYYNDNSSSCYLVAGLRTMTETADATRLAFIKIPKSLTTLTPEPSVAQEGYKVHHAGPKIVAIAVGTVASTAVFLLFLSVGRWYRVQSRRRAQTSEDENFLDTLPGLPPRFSYKDLHIATKGFSQKLGKGGFGTVYEGLLPDRSKVAVKQLESAGQGKKEFRAEVATIGSIRHLHLVRLRGFCMEGPHRLLVYDLMANGSLERFLYRGVPDAQREDEMAPVLNWDIRYEIALGTARGLAYLHEDCPDRIIHLDIKPENILLDINFVAKIADFGLSKLMGRDESYKVTTMRGTRGYMAPEWLLDSPITEKSDVYSFGMVLLAIVAGRKNLELGMSDPERIYLPSWAISLNEIGSLLQIVDERLSGQFNKKQVKLCVWIALWCIQEDPSTRPAMGIVVKMLEGLLEVQPPPMTPSLHDSGALKNPTSSILTLLT
ncbi:hypothetical protein O6H91_22G067600 [Diphasiastrum complanatum]|uniref:Uncharacterized protein n=1 Tax=Diphasiastrum complanatum TaxID=34168 RepID=A0ACC2AGI2_DIPCM|nr:hypothetical protein O6H91_Y250900 [Diphasiastrum complanatum]KAJ7516690.1 hypothetical protein O6H91_22G067600 [Diphasiastrum complanatum]